mgnify:FL=1
MKKFFAFAVVAVAATFASCSGNSDNTAADSVSIDSTIVEEVVAPVDSAITATVDSAKVAIDSLVK